MGSAFTKEEKELIITDLKNAAKASLAGAGMKKTSVDELAAKARISKGMFYKLYKTKELLYFEVVEDLHEDIYEVVYPYLAKTSDKTDKQRFASAVMSGLNKIDELGIMPYIENEMEYLMRKVPKTVLIKHFIKDDDGIKKLMQESNIQFTVSYKVLSATIRSLLGIISRKSNLGQYYSDVIEIIVKGIADEVIIEQNPLK